MKCKVAMVSYKNTLPFLFGLENHNDHRRFDVELLNPAACSLAFANGLKDIALVPVAFLENRNDYKIISDYCIGSNAAVNSVAILSNKPIHELSQIILDNHSITSNRLCKILMEHHWSHEVSYIKKDVSQGIRNLAEDAGVVMIGDKVFEYQSNFKYKYDLSLEWNQMTNHPFVFAVWIAKKELSDKLVHSFNKILKYGVDHIDDILKTTSFENFDLEQYLKVNLEFNFTAENRAGLTVFLNNYQLPAAVNN